ncbi:UDP-N-acetylmuramoyl-tripeptide--D-alanyl-D-alanine ligase [uncultured Hymenobacter sp.]|uniref:UDP-N-acetylmuramoyl-tripeptide--D-alanyl-D- alanine ligase n=1 Tax=uncultured Hymenobacter sp. TaxID=170016 RepID=UPI0035C9C949
MFPTTALYAKFQAAGGQVSTDSRQPQPGTLFFALNGPSFRGADFAAGALAKGASHAVTDDPAPAQAEPARYTFAPDPLQALQELAHEHRRRFRGPVLAITGSNGKTTTKELLTAVLATKYRVLATTGNLNNHIGVPLTLLRLRLDEHELAVVEMGANHQGEIASYCHYAEPTHGLITNIGRAHLEGFGGEAGVAQGKGELFRYLAARGGRLFVNTLDAQLPAVAARSRAAAPAGNFPTPPLLTYPGPTDTYPATLLAADPALALRLWDGTEVAAQLTGAYNFPNLAAAAAVGAFFEVPSSAVAAALAGYNPQNNRSQVIRTARGNALLLDAYNANPSSMEAALRSFARRPTPPGQPRVVVLGDMFELGEASAAEHRALGRLLAELSQAGDLEVVLIGPEMATAASMSPAFRHFASKPEAAEWLRQHSPQGQPVLLKGSRGMGLETLVELL